MHVVLDLDETLVHVVNAPLAGGKQPSFMFYIQQVPYYVYKRPFIDNFLEFLFANFETVNVFTAATRDYGKQVIRGIMSREQRRKLRLFFSREHLTPSPVVSYYKKLSNKFDLSNSLMIDDRKEVFHDNPGNGILVKKFKGKASDKELAKLIVVLTGMLSIQDQVDLSTHRSIIDLASF